MENWNARTLRRGASLALLLAACRAPHLARPPWSLARAGARAFTFEQPLVSVYTMDGDLTVGVPSVPSIGFGDAPPTSGDVAGIYGLALRLDVYATEQLVLSTGVDARHYRIEGFQPLDPIPDFDDPSMLVDGIVLDTDPVTSLQAFVSGRWLFAPFGAAPRVRPYGQVSLHYLPSIEVTGSANLEKVAPGTSLLPFDSVSDDLFLLGLGTGLMWQWSDATAFELGAAYELPLDDLELDINVDVLGVDVVSRSRLEPRGWILHAGVSWFL